ncbi:MAG: Na+/H+ antiporter NhaC family protein, partial [Lachnospiraceae bacterium]|nr:Na+/H+ antiporter NhaC family protein [Lachnospiraceae bacterium]
MEEKSNRAASLTAMTIVIIFLIAAKFLTTPETVQQSFWALVPPIVAIALALITKEVYSSLFFGIVTGALLYTGYHFEATMNHVLVDGVISVLSDTWNVGILCFLVILGAMVQLMNRAGGSVAFGSWAGKHIKSRIGAQLATILLGCLIFIDDYFNCLTVGSVMRPVTDQHKISRAKLAYLIDATAAPICIIAPISSWAAAVSGFVEGENGMHLFIQTIPYNYYAIFTILMMVCLVVFRVDFGSMAVHENNAIKKNDLFTTKDRAGDANLEQALNRKPAKVIDMLVPIISLVGCCVVGMIYTGGFFEGKSFIDAFANSNASTGLVFGSVVALVITLAFYLIRNILSFNQCMECL